MEPEEYTKRAHKVAFAISRKCNIEITVRRIPLTKTLLGFGFVCGAYYTVFGQSFLDGNLATFATRIMEEIQGKRHAIGKHGKIHGN